MNDVFDKIKKVEAPVVPVVIATLASVALLYAITPKFRIFISIVRSI